MENQSNDLFEASRSLTPYQFEGHNFCIVEKDDEFWFVATEVSRELGYAAAKDLTRTLDDDEKGRHNLPTLGGDQEVLIISEPGLYRAIIQRRANKKHDQSLTDRIARFQRWVFHDVLPSIRKTGSYGGPQIDPMKVLNDPAAMRGLLLTYSEKVIGLENKIGEMQPKVEALERIADAHGTFNRTTAAKMLGVSPHALIRWMRTNHWTYRRTGTPDDIAYQSKIEAGLLEHKIATGPRDDGTEWSSTSVRVTAKGLTELAKAFPPTVRPA